ISGIGGTVKSLRPIVQYKQFIPMQKRRNAIGFNVQGSFMTGYGGLVAPPFERFYLGGENDLRGFDIRSVSPIAFLPDKAVISLTNPDGTVVPKDPSNPRRGAYTIPIPTERLVFPGGDMSLSQFLKPVAGTNWTPRMSTGLELQVMLPIINAPFRIYWAYNALRLNTTTSSPVPITRDMFPAGAAGDFTFLEAVQSLAGNFTLREPRKTFRFSVATT